MVSLQISLHQCAGGGGIGGAHLVAILMIIANILKKNKVISDGIDDFKKMIPPPPKFNSSPLKSYRNPIGKDRLPTTIFQGQTVKLRGCNNDWEDLYR